MLYRMKSTCVLLSGVLFATLVTENASSQDFVYKPVNPSFGGSSFNSAHLLAIAAIDRPDPPARDGGGFDDDFGQVTQADLFAQQLERAVLGRLSAQITDAIFGDNAEADGTFAFGNTQVDFETALDGTIFLTISDALTGGQTLIEVPSFLTAAQ